METNNKIIGKKILENGFEIDLDEGWNKLTNSQFGGTPGRAFSELIQNAIDSYPPGTHWNKRKGEINTTDNSISITDWGEGMNSNRLSLITTAGGTDKFGDDNKIGQFGLGFISIFNPKLETEQVDVITKCDGYTVELVFSVTDPLKRPRIKLRVLENTIDFSTKISIRFKNYISVNQCIDQAKKSLTYYPCTMLVNGQLIKSIWLKKDQCFNMEFEENGCKGLIRKNNIWQNFKLLCKYELITNTTLAGFITGCRNMKYNLEDYNNNTTPYVNDVEVLLNVDNLRLTISRDNYYLDWNYFEAKKILNRKLRYFLYMELQNKINLMVIIANQYIFRYEIRNFIADPDNEEYYAREENRLIRLLAKTPAYRINGRPGLYSLVQLRNNLHYGMPFYYSPDRANLRWLGGSFKHDFVVIPDECKIISGAPLLFDYIFEAVYQDVVNLDTIAGNQKKIQNLVERGLVNKSALSPVCKILGNREINSKQNSLLEELRQILCQEEIREMIGNNLHVPVKSIRPVFFSIKDEGIYLSTGLFDIEGKPVSEDYLSNFLSTEDENNLQKVNNKVELLIGLNLDHPFIYYLTECKNPHRGHYALTYLSHELALCQKMLVPYSPFYHLVKEKLAQDMRKVLMSNLLKSVKN
jgi:hypothetical protein